MKGRKGEREGLGERETLREREREREREYSIKERRGGGIPNGRSLREVSSLILAP